MSGEASVNEVRRQIKTALEVFGPVRSCWLPQQKQWMEDLESRLRSRVEQRRERIALTFTSRGFTEKELIIHNVKLVEAILDAMENE